MYVVRLFHRDNPFQQIEALPLQDGNLTVGRDNSAALVVADPSHEVSRLHCEFALRGRELTLQDLSSNGVFIGRGRHRLKPREAVPVHEREPIHIGQYILLVEWLADEGAASSGISVPSLLKPPIVGFDSVAIPADWTTIGNGQGGSDVTAVARGEGRDACFDAFCDGANLDPEQLQGDRRELMRHAGAMYQQMVLGLGVLLTERAAVDDRAAPPPVQPLAPSFFWAPNATVAQDLLRSEEALGTVKAAFIELRKHLLCMMAGSRAVLTAALKSLSPEEVRRANMGGSDYAAHYADVRKRALGEPESPINVAFREAYEQQRRDIDELSTLS
jgi:predicted component of type VI protein secretion system